MLSVKISRGLGQPPLIVEDIQSMVVYDEYGQPLHAFLQLNKDNTLSISPTDKGFEKTVNDLGFKKRCDYEIK